MNRRQLVPFLLGLASLSAGASCPKDHVALSELGRENGFTLRGPLDPDDLERSNAITVQETGEVLPFGRANASWRTMKAMMVPGDKIFHMERRDGSVFLIDGHILVRGDCVLSLVLGRIK